MAYFGIKWPEKGWYAVNEGTKEPTNQPTKDTWSWGRNPPNFSWDLLSYRSYI